MERSKETQLHIPAGSAAAGAAGGDLLVITPESAGWSFAGLRVVKIAPGRSRAFQAGRDELLVLPLTGSATVRCEGKSFALEGRASVFARVSDFAYVPCGAAFEIESDGGGEFALPAARARRKLAAAYGPAESVAIEIRGKGSATRQVNNFCAPGAFEADRLVAVEVLTPGGNWSSYPPHKHDEARAGEAILEEIYYFRVAGKDGFGFHRTYTDDGAIDANACIRDGDAFLIPRGYHGPSVAAPDHPLYYLNVLAGPAAERTMAFCDDPRHAWIRAGWANQAPDPRVPMTSARAGAR